VDEKVLGFGTKLALVDLQAMWIMKLPHMDGMSGLELRGIFD
jgi:hypothetical protein